jgi:hypothetical protein
VAALKSKRVVDVLILFNILKQKYKRVENKNLFCMRDLKQKK